MKNENIVKTLNESYKKLDEVFSSIEIAMSNDEVKQYSEALFGIKNVEQELTALRDELEKVIKG